MKGVGVSPGISIGKAYRIDRSEAFLSGITLQNDDERNQEIIKFENAVENAVNEIEAIRQKNDIPLSDGEIELLDSQIEFLTDPQIKSDVIKKISTENKTANDSVIGVIYDAVQLFSNMDDEYFRARASDIRDTGVSILKFLNNNLKKSPGNYSDNTIIIAEDISPSDTISLDTSKITGLATQLGGINSHTAIIARAKGIPAVVGCGKDLLNIENNDIIILDGSEGEIIIRPGSGLIEEYKIRQQKIAREQSMLKALKNLPAKTTDGHMVKLYGNISDDSDLEKVLEAGGEGVGLFRTELMFLGRNSFPDEEEQFQFYRRVAIKSKNKPVIVRTLDIGGDKQAPYFGIPHENNPALGYRAIRISLTRKEIFFTQLRAIMRAAKYGNLKIMFPMISSIDEVRRAKECLDQVKHEMSLTGIEFDNNIETGIMIEIPSAAMMADVLAKEVDFFSIGTNDLCQYTLAVDRMNNMVSDLYNYFNPGLLRLIQNVIVQAHIQNKPVGMCGEMASDPLAALLLLGMGLDEFSMGAGSIPTIKNIINRSSILNAREICSKVMEMDSSVSIKYYLQEVTK
jgi:phosphoenolpyruvate-protein phosphotransferase (PTS system enzyme I)